MANSPARSSVDVGDLIADTYTIEALIGQGGMGSVFLASHTRLPGKRVAIKFLHLENSDESVILRFKREAEIAAQLDHPNIVRVDDYNVTDDGTPYLVLELLEGESLAARLRQGPMDSEQVLSIVRMVGSAIAAAHANGIIHRDLKPQNIFLVPTEMDGHLVEIAKVLDFGISKMRGRDTVKTQESTLLGTPQYMAPEQATGQHANADERTDIFALGAIIYEMLTGNAAFQGENIPEVVFKVVYEQPASLAECAPLATPELVAAVEKAMNKKQEERFSSVNEFVEELTGRPLVQRGSMISMPPRIREQKPNTTTTGKRVGQAAYANTVDSGNLSRSQSDKAMPKPTTVSPMAETMASLDDADRKPTAPIIAPRPRGLVIGLSLACIVAVGAAIFFATRKSEPDEKPVVAAAQPDAAPPAVAIDAVVAMVPPDASTPAVEIDAAELATPADAAVAVKKLPDAGTKNTGVVTVQKKPDDPDVATNLRKAQSAFNSREFDLAKQYCNAVTNSENASDVQLNKALLLRGTIHCEVNNLIGNAQADLRQMTLPTYRAQLKQKCGI